MIVLNFIKHINNAFFVCQVLFFTNYKKMTLARPTPKRYDLGEQLHRRLFLASLSYIIATKFRIYPELLYSWYSILVLLRNKMLIDSRLFVDVGTQPFSRLRVFGL
jgi:hypothetical protein